MVRANRLLFGCVALLGACGLAASQNVALPRIKVQVVAQPAPPQLEPPQPPAKPLDPVAEDEKTLRDVGVGTDGPAALDYFRKRTLKEVNPKQIESLVAQLGDEQF